MNRTGDTMSLKGKVARKYVEGDDHFVGVPDMGRETIREGVTTPSHALVTLPTRSKSS